MSHLAVTTSGMKLSSQTRKPAGTADGGQYDTGKLNSGVPTKTAAFPNPHIVEDNDDRVDWISTPGGRVAVIPMEASPQFLEKSARSMDDKVRFGVAVHPRTTTAMLTQIMERESSPAVKEAAMGNPNFDHATYQELTAARMHEANRYLPEHDFGG